MRTKDWHSRAHPVGGLLHAASKIVVSSESLGIARNRWHARRRSRAPPRPLRPAAQLTGTAADLRIAQAALADRTAVADRLQAALAGREDRLLDLAQQAARLEADDHHHALTIQDLKDRLVGRSRPLVA